MIGSADRGAIHATAGSRSLEPADFSFYEFGELNRDERRKILRLGIRSDPPTVTVVEDAIFIPNGYLSNSDQSKFAGGIVTADGRPIETAQMHRKGGKRVGGPIEAVEVTPDREVNEDVIYLGMLFNHYGRVLLESLARVWYLSQADPSTKVVFNNANSAQAAHAPWVPKLLSMFGIPPERILALNGPTRLRRAIVPEPLFEQFYSAHEEMLRPFRDIASRVAGDVTPSDQPLYLSRSRLTSRQRPVVGEVELEGFLREQGFAIAYPERMTIQDQVRMINSHRDIFSSLGSAAHNILFALGRPRLHLLASRDDLPANYFLCSALVGAPTTFVNCLGAGGRTSPNEERVNRRAESFENPDKKRPVDLEAGPQSMPQLIEMDRVVNYLEQNGFRNNPDSDSLAALSFAPDLQRQYDEAWFYARLRKASSRPGSLPADIERESLQLASESWPVSFMLARYYARARDTESANASANQFVALVETESNRDRLAYYHGDVRGMATRITRACAAETASRMGAVLTRLFPMGAVDEETDFPD